MQAHLFSASGTVPMVSSELWQAARLVTRLLEASSQLCQPATETGATQIQGHPEPISAAVFSL